jgi:polysaccharide pyruvyl transferase WcaK-like protein
MWINDEFWVRAAEFAMKHSMNHGPIFAPDEIAALTNRCYPISFAYLFAPTDGIALIPKDDVDLLPLSWIHQAQSLTILYIDEVFVALTGSSEPSFRESESEIQKHAPYLFERINKIIAGQTVRTTRIDDRLSDGSFDVPYALIIAASLTNNAGDTLVASACCQIVRKAMPHLACVVVDGMVDRSLVAKCSALFIGPGGMLYDLGDSETRVNLQNIANYFRIGYLAQEYSRPVYVIGIGHQGLVTGIAVQFLQKALLNVRFFSTRDSETSQLAARFVTAPIVTSPDLSTVFREKIISIARQASDQERRHIGLCGDFRQCPDFGEFLGALHSNFPNATIHLIAQANEDYETFIPYASNHSQLLLNNILLYDQRGSSPEEFIRSLAVCDCVITGRFHAMMISLMAGIGTVVFYRDGDKRDRVLRDIGLRSWLLPIQISTPNYLMQNLPMILALASTAQRDTSRSITFVQSQIQTLQDLIRCWT